jgi:S-formylglutathione hydrolase FrmB
VSISIVDGWLPFILQVIAIIAVVVAVDWRRGWSGGWRGQLGRSVLVAGVVIGVVAVLAVLHVLHWSDIPRSGLVWGFVFVFVLSVTVVSWKGARGWRKAVAVVAVLLTLLVPLDMVNRQSGSFPTIGRLVTLDPEHIVETPQLRQIREEVASTGQLPKQGVLLQVVIPPTVSQFSTRPAYVYLPPAWFAKVTPSLPTLMLLPGEPGSASDWVANGDADQTADAFAQSHHGVAPIIVMPDPNGTKTVDSECVNSQFGSAEAYLVEDVPNFVRRQFSAERGPGSLAIGGLSAGGTCSVMLALRHPSVFKTFASFSGFSYPQWLETSRTQTVDTLFGGSNADFDAHDPALLLKHGHFDGLAGWFEAGDQDAQTVQAAHLLQPEALRAGIATCISVIPGGHDFGVWSQALRDSFPWLAWRLGVAPHPADEPARCSSP